MRLCEENFPRELPVLGIFLLLCFPATFSISVPQNSPAAPHNTPTYRGDWLRSKELFRQRDCCVTMISGLDEHVKVLQKVLADEGPAAIDLRKRIRVSDSAYEDCLQIRNSVVAVQSTESESGDKDPCSLALEQLARGVASLADGSLEGVVQAVFCRIVCASDYRARDPPYHTDKAPLRGYVTLRGVGTEFMDRTCNPFEYLTLRTYGGGVPSSSLLRAQELEFIVMKGDYYDDVVEATGVRTTILGKVWKRATACVHRSPPGAGVRRVIVSFDLADGDDDREWYQVNKNREWRSGMTQRKSRLVA